MQSEYPLNVPLKHLKKQLLGVKKTQSVWRASETSEEAASRRQENADRIASQRASETPEEAASRRQENEERMASQRAAETPEQAASRRQENAERMASQLAAETPEEAASRRRQHAQLMANQRASETADEANARRLAVAQRQAERRQICTRNSWGIFEKCSFEYDATLDYGNHRLIKINRMDRVCHHCGALKWKEERAGMCCSGGKVAIPTLEEPVDSFKTLFTGETDESRRFLARVKKYNSCFHMTSFGADKILAMPGFCPTFTVQGQVHHKIGSLLPPLNEQPQFLQVYFMGDYDTDADRRCQIIQGVERATVLKIQQVLHNHNILVHEFKSALENMPDDSCKVVIRAERVPSGQHPRRYNAPAVAEVAAVVAGANPAAPRDIVLQKYENSLIRIADTHPYYDALKYPIIYWKGQEGYHFNIPQTNPNKKVTCMDFYAFHIMVRENNFNLLLRCRTLLSQFLVDMYVKMESERRRYIALNKSKLRAESFIHLQDAIANVGNVNTNDLGSMVILPSSFVNSPRYLHEYTQDAFTYVRNYGRPDLFITMTCNPDWPEIKEELMTGQKPTDRHDIVARVFRMKVQKLVALLTKGQVFGEMQCFMYSIEWQKRGLPHVHLLLWLKEKLRPSQIDEVVSAELLDPNEDMKISYMTPHGVFNPTAPCMKDGQCTKIYPRALIKNTQTSENGYPVYRRRAPKEGGRTVNINLRATAQNVSVDNSWVVPYSPLLCKIFDAHINVEFCSSAIFVVRQQGNAIIDPKDEVQMFRAGRYVSSNEAAWRILGLPLHERHPTVTHLAVHLPNGERVYFTEATLRDRVATPPNTTLTAFFRLCQADEFARTLFYVEVPRYYTWDASRKEWKRRVQGAPVDGWPGVKASDALGRVYTVHITQFECYCVRQPLLTRLRGPTSFQAPKIVDGQEKATFREACEAMGLLEDDGHWDATLEDAILCQSATTLRDLFAIMYKNALSEDIARRYQGTAQADDVLVFNEALKLIEDNIFAMVGKVLSDFNLPTPQRTGELSTDLVRELGYDTVALAAEVTQIEPLLLPEQRQIFNFITNRIANGQGGLFFLEAPGGIGKTFLLNLLLAQLRKDKEVALAVASSGIAATLLSGGRTAHSVFKLPLNLASEEMPTCNISKSSSRGVLMQRCKLIVWDECTMSHKRAIEALDRSLQDIRGNQMLMSGVVVLLAGDFRQTLPVIERGTAADEMNACLKASPLWGKVERFQLKTNMRVQLFNDQESGLFAQTLLEVGEGRVLTDANGQITFDSRFSNVVSLEDNLINEWLCERAIMAPKNELVEKINKKILEQVPGDMRTYMSIDTAMATDDAATYPVEFLNSLDLSGVPSHTLELKVGVPVILMRNLDAPRLCNGTRLRVTELRRHIVQATILTGGATGETVLIPRIPIIPTNLLFQFKRLQFPLKVAFSITINKSQGQTLKVAGIHLGSPCFSHGQLYVACSRVSKARNLFVYAENNKCQNVVYRNVLQ
ncbi:hypothetical protein ABMA27_000223 [Loxostege sticticalis]|uniref:ATP-dependent DNA helicase n=1 Tax=Loxostege sticticalis TaxID=481309 RepID=A0ABR3IML9_LOXSC